MSASKARRIIHLAAILISVTALSFLTDSETNAQTSSSAVVDAPVLKVVSASATAVELSWTPASDAVSYDLRTWWAGADGWQRIDDGSLTGTSYSHRNLPPGRKYYYIVADVDDDGRRGPWSAQVEVTVPETDAPASTSTFTPTPSPASTQTPTPTLTVTATPTSAASALTAPTLEAEAGTGQITLRWGAVTNADSYQLIVWYNSIPDWKAIGGALQGTSYVHDGVAAGTTYYYRVRAVAAGDDVVSAWSGQVSTVATASVTGTQTPTSTASPTLQLTPTPTATAAPLSAPVLSAATSDGAITLTWGAVANADSYQLIVWDGRLNDWRGIGGVMRGTSYTHGGLTAGTTHYYHVHAVAAGGAVSAWSRRVSEVVQETPTATPTPAVTERGALIALYEATDGDNWRHLENWLSVRPLSTWYGVTTDSSGRVSELDLRENNLRGPIPDLSALVSLTNLNLSENRLRGPLPELGAHSEMANLDLSANNLRGPIPNLSNLTNLTTLSLNRNQFTGHIPELSALTKLTRLNVSNNRLTGQIPDLSALTELRFLYLFYNDLTGPIPDLGALTSLSVLNLRENELTGQIPVLSTLTNLRGLSLENNELSGPIPDLSALTNVELLNLYGNELSGNIPKLRALTKLWTLNLGSNHLTGEIPDLSALAEVRKLNLSSNELTGVVPDLKALVELTNLGISGNEITGAIPDLSSLTELTSLILGANQLTGPIPDLSSLTKLDYLHLGGNQLTGLIPDLGALTKLKTLFLGDNQLTGPIVELSSLTKLTGIDIRNNQFSGPIPDLGKLPNLTYLSLEANRLCLPPTADLSGLNVYVTNHLDRLELPTCTDAELAIVPGIPQNLTATVNNDQVSLTWDAAANAASYDLRAWDSINRQWGPIADGIFGRSFLHTALTDGRNYYYQVRARNASGARGIWSPQLYTAVVVPQFPPPPQSLGLDMFYQKYLNVGGVTVVGPSEVSNEKMVQSREIVTAMLSTRPDLLATLAANRTRITIYVYSDDLAGLAQLPEFRGLFGLFYPRGVVIFTSGGWLVGVPDLDEGCYTFIHEFAHAIHFALMEQPGGPEFETRLKTLYDAALEAGLWLGAYASTNVYEYWAEVVTYWFQGSLPPSLATHGALLEHYDAEAAKLIEEVFGDVTIPAYCKP